MRSIRLYPPVPVDGEDYSKVKVVTVPHQSMTLKQIIARFIRKESLPIEREGFYAENLGDLEKMQHEDITVRHERAADLKAKLAVAKRRKEEKEKEELEKASVPPTPPVQDPPIVPPVAPAK